MVAKCQGCNRCVQISCPHFLRPHVLYCRPSGPKTPDYPTRPRRANAGFSAQIGEIVMQQLKGFDKVAYIRFASVYHSFEGLEMFEKELKNLSGK